MLATLLALTWYVIVAAIAFIAGALVYRNNAKRFEAEAKDLQVKISFAEKKIKELIAENKK